MALSLNDLKKGKAGKASAQETTRRMVRPWEDPTQEAAQNITTTGEMIIAGSTDHKRVANRERIGSKEVAEKELFYLVGHERKILQFIFEQCFKEGELISKPFSKDFLATFLETSYGTAKSAILRLEKKGFITRHSAKTGRGGWIRFEIPKDIYQVLLLNGSNHSLVANREQKGSKEVAQRGLLM